MKRIVLLCSLAVLAILSGMAQYIALPYYMGFEEQDSVELTNWVLNPGTQAAACGDQWTVGNAIAEDGSQALYITDGTHGAAYGSQPCTQYAYRDILLPAGNYNLSFDWYCVGGPDSYLAMGMTSTSNNYIAAKSSVGEIASQVQPFIQSSASMLYGTRYWQNVSVSLTSNGVRVIRLFFVWVNNNTNETIHSVGAVIDNIEITATTCKHPTNLACTMLNCDSLQVTWAGASAQYELQYCRSDRRMWHSLNISQSGVSGSTLLVGLEEAYYNFRVRGICTPDTSAWAYLNYYPLFCTDNRCIDFTDLQNSAMVTCTYNSTGYDGYTTNPECAYQQTGIIDNGSDKPSSRHTVNRDVTATDPRTGGNLPLIPDGESASVRLGNWLIGAQAESISYLMGVDSSNALVQIQYAFVTGGGGSDDQGSNNMPRLVIEVLNANKQPLTSTCLHYDILNNGMYPDWQSYGTGSDKVDYIPWSVIGLNLTDYIGQTVHIRFTTYDCSQSGHYGYAYFTLDCLKNRTDIPCGDDDLDRLQAPKGYYYSWYKQSDPSRILSTGRELTIGSQDTSIYKVDCKNKWNYGSDCHFTLTTDPNILLPKAEAVVMNRSFDSILVVNFANLSHAVRINRVTGREMRRDDEANVLVWWDFGDGLPRVMDKSAVVTHTFAPQAADYTVTVYASMDGGDCVDSLTLTIAGVRRTVEVHTEAVNGEVFGGGVYPEDTTIVLSVWPDEGYQFVCWSDSVTDNPRTVHVVSDTTFIGLCVIRSFRFAATSSDTLQGEVLGTEAGVYPYGTEIQVGAFPNSGYRFVKWDNDVTDNPYIFPLTVDTELTAIFEIDTGLETLESTSEAATKVLINGILYIRKGTQRYNAQGVRVSE